MSAIVLPDTTTVQPRAARIACVIPARLESTRLPRKMLASILGRPMLAWVLDAAAASTRLASVGVATDSDEIAALVQSLGHTVYRTGPANSGSDRIAQVLDRLNADVVMNLQGDEPVMTTATIDATLAFFDAGRAWPLVSTAASPSHDPELRESPNAVKVVTNKAGKALYFSRSAIPSRGPAGAVPNEADKQPTLIHLGIYAYRVDVLRQFSQLSPSLLEQRERLEQLRLLDNGIDIQVATVPDLAFGVDTEDDRLRAEQFLRTRGHQAGR